MGDNTPKAPMPTERALHMQKVAEHVSDRVPVRESARQLGRSVSAIVRDRRLLRERLNESSLELINTERGEQLERLTHLEDEALAGWERSVGQSVKQTRRITEERSGRRQTISEITETLSGDPRYLQTVLGIYKRRADLLGLDAPKEVNVESTSVAVTANLDLGLQEAQRFFSNLAEDGAIEVGEVAVQERSVLSPDVRVPEGGCEQAVGNGSVSGSSGKTERDAGSMGAGALQEHDHNIRPDDTERVERSGINGLHSKLQQANGKGIPPTDQGRTGDE